MVKQYPDTIVVSWKDESTQSGGSIAWDNSGAGDHSHTFSCRYEQNSQSRKIVGEDGSLIDYNFDVFMPKTDIEIPDFTAKYVLNGTITGTVKRAKNNQLNSRLWL